MKMPGTISAKPYVLKNQSVLPGKRKIFCLQSRYSLFYTLLFLKNSVKTAIDFNLVLPLPILAAYRKQANHRSNFIP